MTNLLESRQKRINALEITLKEATEEKTELQQTVELLKLKVKILKKEKRVCKLFALPVYLSRKSIFGTVVVSGSHSKKKKVFCRVAFKMMQVPRDQTSLQTRKKRGRHSKSREKGLL